MMLSSAIRLPKISGLRGLILVSFFVARLSAVIQLASGSPVEDEDTAVVSVPLFFYADESVIAGQFDVSVPEGWSVIDVASENALGGVHSVEADELSGGGVRVVVYSLNNSDVPLGSLGTVLMEPPSVGEIASLSFSNSLFITTGGEQTSVTPGFPELQIITQPLNQTIFAGQQATVSVSVLGIDPTYVWYQGSSGDTSNPLGVTKASLKTEALEANASYWVRVTDAFNEVIDSSTAVITVNTGPAFVFSPNSKAVGWRAGSGSANLQTPTGVVWNATSTQPWLSVTNSTGSGPGSIAYTFSENNSTGSRTAQINISGVTYTVTQSARPSLFADYALIDGTAWRWVPWFGFVSDSSYPWVYSHHHGWLYVVPGANSNAFYAYSTEGDLGWLYINQSFYGESVRWIYSFAYESYLLFSPVESLNPTSRLFYLLNEARWFTFPE
jgi:hypothetical protein